MLMEATAFIVHMPRLAVRGVTAAGAMYMFRRRFRFMLMPTARTMDVSLFPSMIMPASGPMYMSYVF